MWDSVVTITQTPYLLRPFLLVLMLGIVAGPVGTIVNLRHAEFSAEAMVHSVFPGIVIGVITAGLGGITIGGGIAAALTALALTALAQRYARLPEAATAVVLTSFYSLGVVLSLRKGDKSGQLEALMFGRLLEFSDARLVESATICLFALLLIAATWHAHIAYAFDPITARLQGVNPLLVNLTLNLAIAAVIVAASAAIGVLLAVGFLVVPGATARLIARTPRAMATIATAATIIGGFLGMATMLIDSPRPISPQAAVTFGMLAMYLLALIVRTILSRVATNSSPSPQVRKEPAHV